MAEAVATAGADVPATAGLYAEKWPVWINWDRRIVSFEEVEGFERLEYPSHDEMFQFAIDKTMDGFAIQ